MITLQQAFSEINQSYPILDNAIRKCSLHNVSDISQDRLDSILSDVSKALSKVDNIIKLVDELSKTLPRYLSFLSGKKNLLLQSLNQADIIIEVVTKTEKSGIIIEGNSMSTKITFKEQVNLKTTNSLTSLKENLSLMKRLLKQTEEMLK